MIFIVYQRVTSSCLGGKRGMVARLRGHDRFFAYAQRFRGG
ncbi:TPA: hypothetical protein ACGG3U_002525 [Legionella pneumophila]|nr:hypothetical protein [Legionella pneumophila]WBV62180.1 hypothetical protein PGH43_09400 [Legionella pneumophila 130b]AGH54118.1 hypothetical protein LPE509_02027 [Legionella pneumophila subsp. pneumophila LPE509]MCW8389084.1 hypothetical protein [Legionella pneumophila]MCW8437362.1 hypothetical protein [Legionella pneumophila]MCW8479781.1 hypothetical protein [Legionella pneumophila]